MHVQGIPQYIAEAPCGSAAGDWARDGVEGQQNVVDDVHDGRTAGVQVRLDDGCIGSHA